MVMKRYPHGAAGEFFFMKRAPSPRPDWIETCAITHGSGNVIDFPMVQDRAALLWVINLGCIDLNQWYAQVRRRRSAGLSALRSRSRDRRGVRSRARNGARRARRARHAEDAVAREDDRLEGAARLRADRARSAAEGGVDVRQGARAGAGRAPSGADHGGVPRREAAARPRARRLQPERVGPHARVDLLGAPPAGGHRVDAGHVEGDRARRPHRGLHDEERPRARREARRSLEAAPRRPRTI